MCVLVLGPIVFLELGRGNNTRLLLSVGWSAQDKANFAPGRKTVIFRPAMGLWCDGHLLPFTLFVLAQQVLQQQA